MRIVYNIIITVLLLSARAATTSAGPANPTGEGRTVRPTAGSGRKSHMKIMLEINDKLKPSSHVQAMVFKQTQMNNNNNTRRASDELQDWPPHYIATIAELELLKRTGEARVALIPTNTVYTGLLYLGGANSFQSRRMVFNTGITESWVFGPVRRDDSMHGHWSYYPEQNPMTAKTYPAELCEPAHIVGYVRGFNGVDDVVLSHPANGSPLTCYAMPLCLADSVSPEYEIGTFNGQGVLGLAPPAYPELHLAQSASFLERLAPELEQRVVSFDLRWAWGPRMPSEISFGVIDRSKILDGRINYTPIFEQRPVPLWSIMLSSFHLHVTGDPSDTSHPISSAHIAGTFQSAATFTTLPLPMARALFVNLGPYAHEQTTQMDDVESSIWFIPCILPHSITIKPSLLADGLHVRLSDLNVMKLDSNPGWCVSGISGLFPFEDIHFGQSFIAQFYVVLEFEDDKVPRIGFGKKADVSTEPY